MEGPHSNPCVIIGAHSHPPPALLAEKVPLLLWGMLAGWLLAGWLLFSLFFTLRVLQPPVSASVEKRVCLSGSNDSAPAKLVISYSPKIVHNVKLRLSVGFKRLKERALGGRKLQGLTGRKERATWRASDLGRTFRTCTSCISFLQLAT